MLIDVNLEVERKEEACSTTLFEIELFCLSCVVVGQCFKQPKINKKFITLARNRLHPVFCFVT